MGEDNKDKSLYAAPKQEPIKEDETLITGAEALMRSLQAEGVNFRLSWRFYNAGIRCALFLYTR